MNCPWNTHPSYNIDHKYVDSLSFMLPSDENILPKTEPDEETFLQFGRKGVGVHVFHWSLQIVNDQEFLNIYPGLKMVGMQVGKMSSSQLIWSRCNL